MEDLGWDWRGSKEGTPQHERIMNGLLRTTSALDELASTIRESDGLPWLQWKDGDQLIFLPRAIWHNFPDNPDIVKRWVLELCEHPDSEIKRAWLDTCIAAFKVRYGRKDNRFIHIDSYRRKVIAKGGAVQAEGGATTQENGEPCNEWSTRCLPDTDGGVCTTEIENETENNTKGDLQASGGQKPGRAPTGKGRRLGVGKSKPTEPPKEFTERQVAFFGALKKVEFYVRGKGIMTAFDAVGDPVRLARNLGDEDTYPLVDVGLIGRLGSWSLENRNRSKVDIGKFILNRARASQERGVPGGQRPGEKKNGYQYGSDLAGKVRGTRNGR
jgi:hypothetical protein